MFATSHTTKIAHFSSGLIGGILTSSGSWDIALSDKYVSITFRNKPDIDLEYPSINAVVVTEGVVWAQIRITTSAMSFDLDGIPNQKGHLLKTVLDECIITELKRSIKENDPTVVPLLKSFEDLFNSRSYLAHFDIAQWLHLQELRQIKSIKTVLSVFRNPYSAKIEFSKEILDSASKLHHVLTGDSASLKQRNNEFVENEIRAHKEFFDTVENQPLTMEQRISSVVMEDRNLLVAAAGSGKTSTVVGKVGYALLTELVQPHEVLVLAFNNHAAKELEERIHERLAPILKGRDIIVKTFHALGMDIMAEVAGVKPSIANFAGGGEASEVKLMTELIDSLLASDPTFLLNWILFLSLCRKPARDPRKFKSTTEWQRYVNETGDYRDGKNGFLTLNGELVKSQGELAIANWLYLYSVPYEYEKSYKYETADRHHRQYKPDFYLPGIDCYLEHYAFDKNGNPPAAFGEKYRESAEWKRHLHQTKGTDIFETTFDDFTSGRLFEKLESELRKRGVEPRPRSRKDVLQHLNQPKITAELSSLLRTFIKHAKSNEISASELQLKAKDTNQSYRANRFAVIVQKVMEAYEAKLHTLNEIDFEDLIVSAAHDVAKDDFSHPYQIILVDEFQDISQSRAKLLLALLDKNPGCKLFAVGDDWQSIYRFAGSDISIFTGFGGIFGHTATNYLTQTFRSNQGIANVAARFVQRNPAQMRKSVEAQDKTTARTVVISQYTRIDEMESLIDKALNEISLSENRGNSIPKVFILSRYRNQVPSKMGEWHSHYSGRLTIEFKTIHSSKGLQADYVILIGLHTRKHAFPSEIVDDPLLQMVMPAPETFAHAEERRLLYVALTRAKHRVYLLGGLHSPSPFIEELMASQDEEIICTNIKDSKKILDPSNLCPQCKAGHLRVRNGKNGKFLGCSEYPSCKYTKNLSLNRSR